MKKITLVATALLVSFATFAQQTWKVDKAHAKIGFTITHLMMSEVDGNFKTFDATITSSKEDFSDAVFFCGGRKGPRGCFQNSRRVAAFIRKSCAGAGPKAQGAASDLSKSGHRFAFQAE
jgi:NADPH-dependent glutamate synthase beta subunit-like oxidoreductase